MDRSNKMQKSIIKDKKKKQKPFNTKRDQTPMLPMESRIFKNTLLVETVNQVHREGADKLNLIMTQKIMTTQSKCIAQKHRMLIIVSKRKPLGHVLPEKPKHFIKFGPSANQNNFILPTTSNLEGDDVVKNENVKHLVTFLQNICKNIQESLKDIESDMKKTMQGCTMIVVFDIPFSVNIHANQQAITFPQKAQIAYKSENTPKALEYKPNNVGHQCNIALKTSINKYKLVSANATNVLDSIFSLTNNLVQKDSVKMLSLNIRNNWHFRNITQGYQLSFFLKKAEINTLNLMRSFYFVIITANTSSFTIQIQVKFQFKNILSEDSMNTKYCLDNFSTDVLNWNNEHSYVFKKSNCFPGSFCFNYKDSMDNDTSLPPKEVPSQELFDNKEIERDQIIFTSENRDIIITQNIRQDYFHNALKGKIKESCIKYKLWLINICDFLKSQNFQLPIYKHPSINESLFERISCNASFQCCKEFITSPEFTLLLLKSVCRGLACTFINTITIF